MKRADRLEELVDILRDGRAHPAHVLADALGVSQRTIYRDVAHLIANGLPIAGEAGVGYVLRAPVGRLPGVLSGLELEALSLGLAVMRSAGDPQMQVAATRTLRRLLRTRDVPKRIRERWGIGVYAGVPHDAETEAWAVAKTQSRVGAEEAEAPSGLHFLRTLRQAIRDRQKIGITYHALDDAMTSRIIRPLHIEFWGSVWTCSVWCELRSDFRTFRIDRMTSCAPAGGKFTSPPGQRLDDFLARLSPTDT